MIKFPHFRMYKKNNHPALIVGEAKIKKENDGFLFRKASHSKKLTTRGYEKVYPNPNPKDARPMFIEKRKRADLKERFSKILPWNYKKISRMCQEISTFVCSSQLTPPNIHSVNIRTILMHPTIKIYQCNNK